MAGNPPSVAIIQTIERFQRTEADAEQRGIAKPLQQYPKVDALDTVTQSDPTMAAAITIEDYAGEILENTVHVTTRDCLE